jgi:hypothetical protein
MVVNDEMERIWKVADMAYFKILSHYLAEVTEENHRTPAAGLLDS